MYAHFSCTYTENPKCEASLLWSEGKKSVVFPRRRWIETARLPWASLQDSLDKRIFLFDFPPALSEGKSSTKHFGFFVSLTSSSNFIASLACIELGPDPRKNGRLLSVPLLACSGSFSSHELHTRAWPCCTLFALDVYGMKGDKEESIQTVGRPATRCPYVYVV